MITLSVVSHGQGALIGHLLDDLARSGSRRVTQVIVTHNIPEPWDPAAHVSGAALTAIANRVPRGFGANHNAAFAHCSTPYFAVVNPDIRLREDPFDAVLAEFATDPRRALVSPRIVNPAGADEDFERTLITPLSVLSRRLGARARARSDPDWLAGMFMVFRADAFRAMGGFDERFFMYCEDADICARLRLAGWSYAVARRAAVVHDAQRASHRSARHLRWHVASLLRMWSSSAFWRYRALVARDRA